MVIIKAFRIKASRLKGRSSTAMTIIMTSRVKAFMVKGF